MFYVFATIMPWRFRLVLSPESLISSNHIAYNNFIYLCVCLCSCTFLYIYIYICMCTGVYSVIISAYHSLSSACQYMLIALHTHVCNFDSAGITPNYISVFNYHVTHLIIFNQHPSFLSLSAH